MAQSKVPEDTSLWKGKGSDTLKNWIFHGVTFALCTESMTTFLCFLRSQSISFEDGELKLISCELGSVSY